jgi:hypothetical protein
MVAAIRDSSGELDSTSYDRVSEEGEALTLHHLRELANDGTGRPDEKTSQLDISTFENNNSDFRSGFK